MEEDEDKDEDQCGDVSDDIRATLVDHVINHWPVHEGGWAKSQP